MSVSIKEVSQAGVQLKVSIIIQLNVPKVIFVSFIQKEEHILVEDLCVTNANKIKGRLNLIIVPNVVGIFAMNV
jgi:hypothetical protein